MARNHYHVWFYPGADFSTSNTKYYLGYLLSTDGEASTRTRIEVQNTVQPVSAGDHAEPAPLRGHKLTKQLDLVIEPWMVFGPQYVVDIPEYATVSGVSRRVVWLETPLINLYEQRSAYEGKVIEFANNTRNVIISVLSQEPGTDMYRVALRDDAAYSGQCSLGFVHILPAREVWWENWLLDIITANSVGVLELAYGERDMASDSMSSSYVTAKYKAAIRTPQATDRYGSSPLFSYSLVMEGSRITDNNSEGSVSSVQNLEASDREYIDAIVLSWDDLPFATRYQVYSNATGVTPDVEEEHTLTNGIWIPQEVSFTAVTNEGGGKIGFAVASHDLTAGMTIHVDDAAYGGEYVVDAATTATKVVVAGTFGATNTGRLWKCAGCVAEFSGAEFSVYATHNYTPLGFIFGQDKAVPDDGTTTAKRKYVHGRCTDPDWDEKEYVVAEKHLYFWIRARIGNNGSVSEWSELSRMAHGATKAA
ncbi:MAG: hypothetical protein GX600_11910 [Dehalococcoidia bacterium]|nr:hypothetical protein [Dehalococcoidia bacterium]